MSDTATKRAHAAALADAEAFRDLFPPYCRLEWEFAGSVRRRVQACGDVEHVVMPGVGEVRGTDLFATPETVNLLWHHLDSLVATGVVTKHIYGATGPRWGQKYRGVDWRGYLHELFAAGAENWGPTLAIRTGSADFSKRLVTGLLRNGLRNRDGYVHRCQRCDWCEGHRDKPCGKCDGTGLLPVERLTVATEREYFALAGVPWVEPERRR